jgi:hypothetical protein
MPRCCAYCHFLSRNSVSFFLQEEREPSDHASFSRMRMHNRASRDKSGDARWSQGSTPSDEWALHGKVLAQAFVYHALGAWS